MLSTATWYHYWCRSDGLLTDWPKAFDELQHVLWQATATLSTTAVDCYITSKGLSLIAMRQLMPLRGA
jgi:hypothetical protein